VILAIVSIGAKSIETHWENVVGLKRSYFAVQDSLVVGSILGLSGMFNLFRGGAARLQIITVLIVI
jgi:hypothetical protein